MAMTTEAPPCIHHDRIAPPDGPESVAGCLKCGRVKWYSNGDFYSFNIKETLQSVPVKYQQERVWDEES
jgi:hypothetical protein